MGLGKQGSVTFQHNRGIVRWEGTQRLDLEQLLVSEIIVCVYVRDTVVEVRGGENYRQEVRLKESLMFVQPLHKQSHLEHAGSILTHHFCPQERFLPGKFDISSTVA